MSDERGEAAKGHEYVMGMVFNTNMANESANLANKNLFFIEEKKNYSENSLSFDSFVLKDIPIWPLNGK